jgi:monoamine oxidase
VTAGSLAGTRVLVVGAGLAGLAAARDLMLNGADTIVFDARTRPGGRVWTVRQPFTAGQHGEAGGDMIDEGQQEIRQLARELGLPLTRILRGGWGYVHPTRRNRARLSTSSGAGGWTRLAEALAPSIRGYRLAEQRWDSTISVGLARRSVADWLEEVDVDGGLRAVALGLRGFFLADPHELSLLAYVDQFASEDQGAWRQYRVVGGNDRLAAALASSLGGRVKLASEVVAVSHRGRDLRASVRNGDTLTQLRGDYLVFAVPTKLLRRIPISPPLPAPQHDAIAALRYGRATRTLIQFPRRFWRAKGRPRAFGSSLPFGALWDANEEQRGSGGIVSLLAGGSASDATQALVRRGGIRSLVASLGWLGAGRLEPLASHQTVWEADPWAQGGYAFFDPSFDPTLRSWLARPCGRLFFAGEHTSMRWQGYMNGAVESGRRAAAEVEATHRLISSAR